MDPRILVRSKELYERELRAEPFLEGREDEEMLGALIAFDVVRKGGQEGT